MAKAKASKRLSKGEILEREGEMDSVESSTRVFPVRPSFPRSTQSNGPGPRNTHHRDASLTTTPSPIVVNETPGRDFVHTIQLSICTAPTAVSGPYPDRTIEQASKQSITSSPRSLSNKARPTTITTTNLLPTG